MERDQFVELITTAGMAYGASSHGYTETEIDLEFPCILAAALFADNYPKRRNLRLISTVKDFTSPVVMAVFILDHNPYAK